MERKLITSADEYARQAEEHEDEGMDWSETVPVDPAIWHEILDRFPDLENTVVDHLDLPIDVIYRLTRSSWEFVRYQIAFNERLTPQLASNLIHDIDPRVREGVAYRRDISVEQLRALVRHGDNVPNPAAAEVLKSRFAMHWRDVVPDHKRKRIEPYSDPELLRNLFSKAGHPRLNPNHPRPTAQWMDAICCEEDIGFGSHPRALLLRTSLKRLSPRVVNIAASQLLARRSLPSLCWLHSLSTRLTMHERP